MSIVLETERLILRAPQEADIAQFVPLIGDFDVAKNLSRVPHPYTEQNASVFLELVADGWAKGDDLHLAMLRKTDGAYIGTVGVHPSRDWELGYWVGKPYWGRGYATEAGARALSYAFDACGAERLNACWFIDNPASGRVLEKLGFTYIGEGERDCVARACRVAAHLVALDRATYETRKKKP